MVVSIVIDVIFGLLGGLLGVAIFKKNTPPPAGDGRGLAAGVRPFLSVRVVTFVVQDTRPPTSSVTHV